MKIRLFLFNVICFSNCSQLVSIVSKLGSLIGEKFLKIKFFVKKRL